MKKKKKMNLCINDTYKLDNSFIGNENKMMPMFLINNCTISEDRMNHTRTADETKMEKKEED